MKKNNSLLWITSLGQTLYENLNPFWSFCEKLYKPPEKIILFHELTMEKQKNKVINGFSVISDKYFPDKTINIEAVSFDDENVNGFKNKLVDVFNNAQKGKMKIIVDVSPTTWSFVPIYFMELSKNFKNNIQSIVYFQYAQHNMRNKPYPLIPHLSITINELHKTFTQIKKGKQK